MSLFYAMKGRSGDWIRRRVFALGGSLVGQQLHRLIWARVATRNTFSEM
jgi:hypothetical protein